MLSRLVDFVFSLVEDSAHDMNFGVYTDASRRVLLTVLVLSYIAYIRTFSPPPACSSTFRTFNNQQ